MKLNEARTRRTKEAKATRETPREAKDKEKATRTAKEKARGRTSLRVHRLIAALALLKAMPFALHTTGQEVVTTRKCSLASFARGASIVAESVVAERPILFMTALRLD